MVVSQFWAARAAGPVLPFANRAGPSHVQLVLVLPSVRGRRPPSAPPVGAARWAKPTQTPGRTATERKEVHAGSRVISRGGGRLHFSRGAPASRNLSWNAEPPDGLATCEKKNEKPPGYGSTIKQRQGRRVGPALPPPRTSSASARPVSSCGCVGS